MATTEAIEPIESSEVTEPHLLLHGGFLPLPGGVYDRASLTGDFMVTILDQKPEDFERDAPEMRICEYLDGVIYLPSPATDRHQEQVGLFLYLLMEFACEGRCGKVLMGPAVLRLTPQRKLEPDLFVRPIDAEPDFMPLASFVLEVLSRSTRTHDLGRKLNAFREANIPEVWFVDDANQRLIVERLVNGRYLREVFTQGPVRSTAIPGFWINAECLWQIDLTHASRCLEAILAGPPPA